ncbi:haloacid dehalogenase type II [Raineyella fluvialis]|uniref:Haloacid dehalogenase type II n=1 Tax=Raineyella fluvialis TaxID=2662261 RepID=A0A5Q2FDH2_9ACTN|nr:haloacid dehalogenase type II [Raineyella fluvialis]QGF22346.1 haloacid dehalogenase type II [Raineyella fluvialis]
MMTPEVSVIAFDVNETLSDMSGMAERFVDICAPADLARLWFATVLREGFALAAAGDIARFADIGTEVLHSLLVKENLDRDLDEAVAYVMAGFTRLPVHPDVVAGIRALKDQGLRLVTLSNGATSVAEALLGTAGVRDDFEALLSVEDAGVWKPARAAYDYAVEACGVRAEEMMLVAVHPWDTHGASRAGLRSAWLNRNGATYPGYLQPADVTAPTLVALAESLRDGQKI